MRRLFVSLLFFGIMSGANAQTNADSSAIVHQFITFQQHYLSHADEFYQFNLYSGQGADNGPPFVIIWNEVERYFTHLRTNVPQVGNKYIQNERKAFQESEAYYKEHPDEEIAVGIDYDRWAGGQESADLLVSNNICAQNKYSIKYIDSINAILIISYPVEHAESIPIEEYSQVVPVVKELGKWVIADNIIPYDYYIQQKE